jgi:hypothetical protein
MTIEPIVADFDPTTSLLSDFYVIEKAAGETLEPDLTAPYECEDEGLNWAYYSWQSDWEAIISIAHEQAPGTIPFMESLKQMVSLDEPVIKNLELPSCQELVEALQEAMDDQAAVGNDALLDMTFDDALEIGSLSFYIQYLEDDGPECMPEGLRAQVEALSPPGPEPATTTSAP